MNDEKESGWFLVWFNPRYFIYEEYFYLGQQFKLRLFYPTSFESKYRHEHDRDSFTVYHKDGDIGKAMGRCQGQWVRITNKDEHDIAKMLYPDINFEVDYDTLSCN